MIRAVGHSAAQLARVTPYELSEVEDCPVVLRAPLSVIVEGLFLVPAVDHGASHLDEVSTLLGGGTNSAQIAASAVLQKSAFLGRIC